ncbi:hypothetical protein X801_05833 [Opisthorchis viverrini]|uniref:Uncharacterized protein n=1 Tax=Opisthorchis viverrini TaxID=6198 RepID=A0A1S8WV28_OPIVI|nr:hypothetical protein X801_05833 [Opisthorchis viverrini]
MRKLVTKLQPSVDKRTSVLNKDVLTIKRKFSGNFGTPSSSCMPLKKGEACQPITSLEAKHLIDQKTSVRCFQPMAAELLASVPRCQCSRDDVVYLTLYGALSYSKTYRKRQKELVQRTLQSPLHI